MPVKSIAECSIPCSKAFCILQYFRPSLNYHLSLRPLLCLFLSGRLRQVLLYVFHLTSGKADMECHICLHVWSLKTCFSICMHLTRDKTDMGRHVLFACVGALLLSQHFYSHGRTFSCHPRLTQY